MGIAVHFYEFSKRENSTKRPAGSGTTAYCNLKDGCGIIAPVIEISAENPTRYNYAYISEFDRYYYVSNWTYYRGLWSASLSVDALASWKDTIGASTQYVLRSSATVDRNVVDNLYPAKADFTYNIREFSNPFVDSVASGCFALKVINTLSNAGPQNYLLTKTEFASFMSYLYSTINWANINPAEISIDLQKALINPFQYVVSCTWLPLPHNSVWGGNANIRFGYWDSEIQAKTIPLNASAEGSITVLLSSHPQKAARGDYLDLEPYTRRMIYFPVLGLIPLDTTMLAGATSIKLSWHIDMCSGDGNLEIFAVQQSGQGAQTEHLINILKYKVGVPITVSQMQTDIIGGVTGAIGAISGITSAIGGNIMGGITNAVSGISSAISSMTPQPQTHGSTGSFADYVTSSVKIPKILSQFANLVDDDNADRGRPVCKMLTLSGIPGYILVADADIAIPGTSEENTAIKGYLENGFFYE